MLPDFPTQKKKLAEIWHQYLYQRYREYLGFWSQLPTHNHPEGGSWSIERADGTKDTQEYRKLESMFFVTVEEAPTLTADLIRKKLDMVARDMAQQTSQGIFETLNDNLEKHGQLVDAEGRPFSKELFLELLEKVEFDFTKDGKPILPSLLMHPRLYETIKDVIATWETDPGFATKHEQIIELKRMNWRDRESRRKLVD